MSSYPKRLIEVDLPIARISAHARREKSIRHGHISTLHIWWARRPLAACRAVICASLWPDPEDLTAWLTEAESSGAEGEFGPEIRAPRGCKLTEGVLIRPKRFLDEAQTQMRRLAEHFAHTKRGNLELVADLKNSLLGSNRDKRRAAEAESARRFEEWQTFLDDPDWTPSKLRRVLLTFIAWSAGWEQSTMPTALETSRALTQAAHEALGGEPGTRPLVVDPFAGGGSIPLEALRVGADAFASDLNPVAVLLNKVVLEYIPKYGQKLADGVRKWGQCIKEQAEKELAEFYPKDPDGATPIAYLWARTILSEAPGLPAGEADAGEIPVEVPLMRSLWLAKKAGRKRALRWVRNAQGKVKTKTIDVTHVEDGQPVAKRVKRPLLEIFEPTKDSEVEGGTVARGSATCPVTGFTTKVDSVRAQLRQRRGGAADARLFCVVTTRANVQGRFYRLPTKADQAAFDAAAVELFRRCEEGAPQRTQRGAEEDGRSDSHPLRSSASSAVDFPRLKLVPDEVISLNELRRISVPIYGMERWGDLFSPRQALALATLARLVREAVAQSARQERAGTGGGLPEAVQTVLGLAVSRLGDIASAHCRWENTKTQVRSTFARQAIGMVWDFGEPAIFTDAAGNYAVTLGTMLEVIDRELKSASTTGHIEQGTATAHPLPDDAAAALVTDPPYYDAVPYAYLSDFFYVWIRRTLGDVHPALFGEASVPKDAEIVVDRPHKLSKSTKDIAFYERELTKAFAEGRRVLAPSGVGTIVFASKTTASWEAILKAVIDAGFVVTGSWPIDTEMETRVAAQGQARLGSSVHIACRPRENPDGSLREETGEWREVLAELPERIHDWMPRLAEEGVVGADAIFACLGPALEIFSRYSSVEKASGEMVSLGEYLEQVWAAVSKEALSMLFADADAGGLEPDARLTAMWLWTLGAGKKLTAESAEARGEEKSDSPDAEPSDEEEDASGRNNSLRTSASSAVKSGYVLEFDAARKIAQGLGAHLDKLPNVVEIKGDKARLLPVAERTKHLFGKDEGGRMKDEGVRRRKKKTNQLSLFEELDVAEAAEAAVGGGWGNVQGPAPGTTVLDRVHQAMILFAAGRGEALKRFLVEDGAGTDARFWKLAQSLSALYPTGSDEKRWVDGVLGRKKGLGL